MKDQPGYKETRRYGNSSFSFFEKQLFKMKIALFPGSFDPITIAHVDILKRSLPLFDKIVVGIGLNSSKQSFLSAEKRQEIVSAVFSD